MIFNLVWLPVPFILIFGIVAYQIFKILTQKPTSANGKVVVITGCSSGIGLEVVRLYAKQGAKLVLAARRVDKLKELVQSLSENVESHIVETDVAKEEHCRNLIEESVRKFGKIDILICNAGLGQAFFLEAAKDTSGFRNFMDINYWGCVYPTYYSLPHLRETKGQIVVISSMGGLVPFPRQTIYNSTKFALQGFYETLRTEVYGSGVSITIVNPGFIKTEMTTGSAIGKDGKMLASSSATSTNASSILMNAEDCASIIVDGISKKKRQVIVPSWYQIFPWIKFFVPELFEIMLNKLYVPKQKKSGTSSAQKKEE